MYAVVQVRGVVKTRKEIKDTLKMLRLHHINHCVIVPDTPEMLGMIRKVKDYVAWGEITPETLETLLQTRGRLEGNDPLTDEYVREHTGYAGIAELAEALIEGATRLRDIPGLKPVLRLHPPRKGYKTTQANLSPGRSARVLRAGDQRTPL